MNDLKIFENKEFGKIRTVIENGETWFIGKEVADILEYANTAKAIRDHVDEEDKLTERIVLSGQNREVIFINESVIQPYPFKQAAKCKEVQEVGDK